MTRNELENKILELVNNANDMSYSDIQGVAMAITMEAIKE